MHSNDYYVVIPARYDSSRFPGKPLQRLCGKEMVLRTYDQCKKAVPEKNICVATDNPEIYMLCEKNRITTYMTSKNCMTGTDRVAEVAEKRNEKFIINVQGDEPIFSPNDLRTLIDSALTNKFEVMTGYCQIESHEQFISANIPKAVMRPDGRLLYMSRSPIPGSKTINFEYGFRQVCAYAFSKNALKAFTNQPKKTALERVEDIEILRFLELGYEVHMVKMSNQSISVDCHEDVRKVERFILEKGL
jgi:3-deoxy-manno-octulosonate cytidylyltransferase (CMP-KDO synthetase)